MEKSLIELISSNQQNQSLNNGQNICCNMQLTIQNQQGITKKSEFWQKKQNRTIRIQPLMTLTTKSTQQPILATVTNTTPKEMKVTHKLYHQNISGTVFKQNFSDAYEKIKHWRQNLFTLPSGAKGKKYINEITCLLKLWIQDSLLKTITIKMTHLKF